MISREDGITEAAQPARDTASGADDPVEGQVAAPAPSRPLACMDCGKLYRDFSLDSTLPDDEWALINDSEGGVLCANCMVARIKTRVPGAVAVRMRIDR